MVHKWAAGRTRCPQEREHTAIETMSDHAKTPAWAYPDFPAVLARWILGGVFLYMGLSKALHPVDFLKLLRQFELPGSPIWLNLIAAILPWFEIACGLLLVAGVAV